MELTEKQKETLIIGMEEHVAKEKNNKLPKTTYEERCRATEEVWKRKDKAREDKLILILKIQDVFNITPALPYEILETLEDDDIEALLKSFNKTNNDCDKQIVHKLIDNSF